MRKYAIPVADNIIPINSHFRKLKVLLKMLDRPVRPLYKWTLAVNKDITHRVRIAPLYDSYRCIRINISLANFFMVLSVSICHCLAITTAASATFNIYYTIKYIESTQSLKMLWTQYNYDIYLHIALKNCPNEIQLNR